MAIPEDTQEQIAKAIKAQVDRKRIVTIDECVIAFLSRRDGPTLEALFPMTMAEKYGFWRQMAADEVRRQFKLSMAGPLWQTIYDTASPALRRSIQGLPAMLCIDGSVGRWVSTCDATDEEIEASENLRHRAAEVTEEAAKRLRRVKNALRKHGVSSLRELANGHRNAA